MDKVKFDQQLEKPKVVIHVTPVILPIVVTIRKDKSTSKIPIIARVMVFLADSIFFASPPAVENLIPDIIIIIAATVPTKANTPVTAY